MGQQKQIGKDCLVIPLISFTSFLSGLLLSEKVSCPCYYLNQPFSSSRDPTSHLLKVQALFFFSNVIIQSKCLLIFSILLTDRLVLESIYLSRSHSVSLFSREIIPECCLHKLISPTHQTSFPQLVAANPIQGAHVPGYCYEPTCTSL